MFASVWFSVSPWHDVAAPTRGLIPLVLDPELCGCLAMLTRPSQRSDRALMSPTALMSPFVCAQFWHVSKCCIDTRAHSTVHTHPFTLLQCRKLERLLTHSLTHIHTYAHIHTYKCMHMHTLVYAHTDTYARTLIHMHVFKHTHADGQIGMHSYMHAHLGHKTHKHADSLAL